MTGNIVWRQVRVALNHLQIGSGGMVVMDEDNCMVDVARYFIEFTHAESCGKCVQVCPTGAFSEKGRAVGERTVRENVLSYLNRVRESGR